jgi:hypothetical protein
MDPLIALLIGIGWLIVKALQSRKKDAESWDELEGPTVPPPHVPDRNQGAPPRRIEAPRRGATTLPLPPLYRGPQPRQAAPPVAPARPVVRPVTSTSTTSPAPVFAQDEAVRALEDAVLRDSRQSYARAAKLQQDVASRLSTIEKQTTTAKPAEPKPRLRPPAAAHILKTMHNPITVRQAFLASFVLNPPKALE